MTKHAPGPWKVDPVCLTMVYQSDGYRIANTYRHPYDIPESKANARLIAAAPDLLETLRMSCAVLGRAAQHEIDGARAVFFKVTAAIAKAEDK